MQMAQVIGRATATVRHKSLGSVKLLICQTMGVDKKPTGDPLIAVDRLGAGAGDIVLISSDGLGLRELLGDNSSPARWWVQGLVDQK
jgi:ethanolamine utilization protein EutN